MISTAKRLEEAEKALRPIVCNLAAGGSGSPNVYATILELAEETPHPLRRRQHSRKTNFLILMLGAGVEPALVAQQDPKSCASANFATRAAEGIIDL
jgi:hypothetical protein